MINILETKLNKAVIESERKDLELKIIKEREYVVLIRDDILLEKYKKKAR